MAKKTSLRLINMDNSSEINTTEADIVEGVVVEMTKPAQEEPSDDSITVKRHKFDSLTLYEISESELDIIEKGSPTSIYLNFAIGLLSNAASFLIALLTSDYTNNLITFFVFLFFTVNGFIVGIILKVLWFRTKNDFSQTIKKIKSRTN
jgi:hypothetical protein